VGGIVQKSEAWKYISCWAEHLHRSLASIVSNADGGFRAFIGTPEFEFVPDSGVLRVRLIVYDYGSRIRQAYVDELITVMKKDHEIPDGTVLELDHFHEETRGEPRLVFRFDIKKAEMSETVFIKLVEKLRSRAYHYNRNELIPAFRRVHKREEQEGTDE